MNLKRSSIKISALAMVAALSTFAAAASYTDSIGLKLGAFYPTSRDVRDNLGKTGFEVGLSYYLPNQGNMESSIDVDYFRVGGSDYFQAISAGFTGRFFSAGAPPTAPYLGFSAGVSFNKVKSATLIGGGSGGSTSEDKTQVYGEVLAGYRFNKQSSVEAFYRITAKIAGLDSNAIGVRGVFRF